MQFPLGSLNAAVAWDFRPPAQPIVQGDRDAAQAPHRYIFGRRFRVVSASEAAAINCAPATSLTRACKAYQERRNLMWPWKISSKPRISIPRLTNASSIWRQPTPASIFRARRRRTIFARVNRPSRNFKQMLSEDPNNLSALDGIGSIVYNMGGTPFDAKKIEESKTYHQRHIALKPRRS